MRNDQTLQPQGGAIQRCHMLVPRTEKRTGFVSGNIRSNQISYESPTEVLLTYQMETGLLLVEEVEMTDKRNVRSEEPNRKTRELMEREQS